MKDSISLPLTTFMQIAASVSGLIDTVKMTQSEIESGKIYIYRTKDGCYGIDLSGQCSKA